MISSKRFTRIFIHEIEGIDQGQPPLYFLWRIVIKIILPLMESISVVFLPIYYIDKSLIAIQHTLNKG